jgi:endonuclease-3
MPRKSPRARSKSKPEPRLRGSSRPRAKPGRKRATRSESAGPASRRAPRGARARGSAHGREAATPPRARKLAPRRPAPRRPRFTPPDPERVAALLGILDRLHPEARTALRFENPLQLLVATILSAQCTDERVNKVTPGLFARYPDAAALAAVPQAELEAEIRSTGFFRNKARAIRECCADIVQRHGGQVPRMLEELTALHGVGRKTANVVLGNAFGIPGLVVDTHVARLSNRLGLTREHDPTKIEFALMPIVPREQWTVFSHWLILHGRSTCIARKPRCSICALAPHCPRLGVSTSQ